MADTTFVKWNLDDIVSLDKFEDLYADVKNRVNQLAARFDRLTSEMSEADFRDHQTFIQKLGDDMSRLGYRPGLMESVNSSDETALALKSRVNDLGLNLAEVSRKFDQWFKGLSVDGKAGLDDVNAKRLFSIIPELTYAYEFARTNAHYSLPLEQESIIAHKDTTGLGPLVDMRDLLVADQRYSVKIPGRKPLHFQTDDEVKSLIYDTDRTVREAAYRSLIEPYKQNIIKYFSIYESVVKDWDYEAKLRGYDSPISMRNVANQVPDRAIEVLMDVCTSNTAVFADYFKYKAKKLGLAKLRRFDIYANLIESSKQIAYNDAVDVVLTTFDEFSSQFGKLARRIIDDQHIDSQPHPKKRGGAFCATVNSKISPYVFLNYTGTNRDVSTLAHELGHGVHSLYAEHLPSAVQSPGLPLAETASTLAEMILFEKLLDAETEAREKEAMLSDKMADAYATICRQSFFIVAELEAHKRMADGLTATQMGELWLKTLTDQFGDSVEVDPIFAFEWAYIPHIVRTPFYCYSYNFGELLSLALFAKYKSEGKSFVPKIEAILSAGGSRDPQKVLSEVAIDMNDPAFWQGSFMILENWMRQLNNFV